MAWDDGWIIAALLFGKDRPSVIGSNLPRLAKSFLGEYVPSDQVKIIGKDDFVIA